MTEQEDKTKIRLSEKAIAARAFHMADQLRRRQDRNGYLDKPERETLAGAWSHLASYFSDAESRI